MFLFTRQLGLAVEKHNKRELNLTASPKLGVLEYLKNKSSLRDLKHRINFQKLNEYLRVIINSFK